MTRESLNQVAVLHAPGEIRFREPVPASSPGPDEVKVRVHRVGVCGTDLHAYAGRQPFFDYPRVLGHELGVEVIEPGHAVQGLHRGDRCAVEPYLHCGECPACRAGRGNCCQRMRVLGVHADGGLLGELTLPAEKLHAAHTLSYEQLALVETLSIGAHAVSRAGVTANEPVLVVGAGPIGLGAALAARAAGGEVAVLDRSDTRLAFAAEQGITRTVQTGDDELDRLRRMYGGQLPAVVLDATGHAGSMRRSFDRCEHAGRLVYIGLVREDLSFHDPDFHRKELTLLASRNALPADFDRVIGWLEDGVIDAEAWVTERVAPPELPAAYDRWTTTGEAGIKAMVARSFQP